MLISDLMKRIARGDIDCIIIRSMSPLPAIQVVAKSGNVFAEQCCSQTAVEISYAPEMVASRAVEDAIQKIVAFKQGVCGSEDFVVVQKESI